MGSEMLPRKELGMRASRRGRCRVRRSLKGVGMVLPMGDGQGRVCVGACWVIRSADVWDGDGGLGFMCGGWMDGYA